MPLLIFRNITVGYKLPNVRILADEYAEQGLRVLIPDLFDGAHPNASLLVEVTACTDSLAHVHMQAIT